MKFSTGIALAGVAMLLYVAALQAGGWEFREATGSTCRDHAPSGWSAEATSVRTVDWRPFPPHTSCELVNNQTGESITWDTGSESSFWLISAILVGVLALMTLAGSMIGSARESMGGHPSASHHHPT